MLESGFVKIANALPWEKTSHRRRSRWTGTSPGQTGFDRLFAWCTVATPTADPDRLTSLTSEATARYLRELQERIGACVVSDGVENAYQRAGSGRGGWLGPVAIMKAKDTASTS